MNVRCLFGFHDWLVVRKTSTASDELDYYYDRNSRMKYCFLFRKSDRICRKCGKIKLSLAKAIKKSITKDNRKLEKMRKHAERRVDIERNDDELKDMVHFHIGVMEKSE